MRAFVLDASVALAWFIDTPVPAHSVQVRQALLNGACAHVPALWHLEMANGIVVAERRRILDADEAVQSLKSIELLAMQAVETHGETIPVGQVFATARSYHLSAYDAVYFELARKARLALATLDRSLRTAATQAGVEIFR